MSSTYSRTTIGGTTFDLLCSADSVPNYACDAVVDLRREHGLARAKEKLTKLVRDNISSLEIGMDRQVEKFYIGKTSVQRNRRSRRFDPMKYQTWRKKGISSRWGEHKHNPYGRDGLVVLGVVNRDAIPRRCRVDQELYALALEQQLLHHFMIEDPDDRIANETFSPGRREEQTSVGHAVYMAYALAPKLRTEEPSAKQPRVQFSEPSATIQPSSSLRAVIAVLDRQPGTSASHGRMGAGAHGYGVPTAVTTRPTARARAETTWRPPNPHLAAPTPRDREGHSGGQGPPRENSAPVRGAPGPVATTPPTTTCLNNRCKRNRVPKFKCPSCNHCYHKKCFMEMTVPPEATFQCGFEAAQCALTRGRGVSWVRCGNVSCRKTFHKNCVEKLLQEYSVLAI